MHRIEFYAPWCSHCQDFRPTWEDVAMHFHHQPEKKVKVGKIDGDSERALSSRFAVKAYPSFFLVDGYTVYEYDGSRSKQNLVDFAEGGYRKTSSIPFLSSPMGPFGLCQGAFLAVAYGTFHTIEWLQSEVGLSPFFAIMFLFGSVFFGIFIAIVVAAVALTPKEKQH